jgi:microcystin-dependent protein
MADPFVAEIRIFPFNFAPQGWAFCNGQLMPISQNTALFSLLGTTYGGNGKSTFALPDLQGASPVAPGQGPRLSLYNLGETGGQDSIALIPPEMPAHTHTIKAQDSPGSTTSPEAALWAIPRHGRVAQGKQFATSLSGGTPTMGAAALAPAGNGQPHNNLPPYLVLNFCIALQGVFPPRS